MSYHSTLAVPQSDFVNRGQDLVAAGQFQEAVKVCRLGLLGRPAVAEGRVVLAQALRGLRRYDEVIAEMRVAIDLDPTLVDAHVLRAEALLRTGEVHAAIEALQRARRLAPADPRIAELLDEAEQSSGGRPASTGDDTVKRPAARAGAAAVPEAVDDVTSSGAIEVDPEVEGVEVREDFDEMAVPRLAPPVMPAPASAPVKGPATMALPAPVIAAGARRGSPTKPPPGAQSPAVKADGKSTFPATLAMPSAFDPPPRTLGGAMAPPGESTPQAPKPASLAVLPTMALNANPPPHALRGGSAPIGGAGTMEPPMSLEQQQSAVNVAKLFADSASNRRGPYGAASVRDVPHPLSMTLAGVGGAPLAPAEPAVAAASTAQKSARSPLRLAVWVLVGVVVIGAGLAAGYQIRGMRLDKQIKAAQTRVQDVTKSDTWAGWTSAAESLGAVADAAGTVENRAALARARALIAYEFGDGQPEAERLVESLAGAGGLDGKIAASYVALMRGDGSAAKEAATAAMAKSSADPAAIYVASQAALINGDFANAVALGKNALSKEPRPQYAIGLARVYTAASAWGDALNAVQRVLAGDPNHPSAVLERGLVLATSGRIAPGVAAGKEIRAQIETLLAQPRTLAPAQIGFGNLVLARIDAARNDVAAARHDVEVAAKLGLDDQRFAEEAVETLYALGELSLAQKAAASALASWPKSQRTRIAAGEIALAQGRASDAVQACRQPDLAGLPQARAILGQARLALDDVEGARKDFDAALKAAPQLEAALIGRASLDIALHQPPGDAAKKLAERVASGGATPAVVIGHAAVLRSTGELAQRDQARQLLEAVISGAPNPDLGRAQLELARVYRDSGDLAGARKAYSDASARGSYEARLESGLLAIDDRDPKGGAAALGALLKDSGKSPRASLVIEVIRARVLAGDHAGAAQLLETAAKLPGVLEWKVNRERGRLALRRGDIPAATAALTSAIKDCQNDPETFLLAADAAGASGTAEFTQTVDKLYRERIDGTPEASLVNGKLLLAAGSIAKAEKAYIAARDALKSNRGSPRLVAQANFGLAVIAYTKRNDPDALAKLNLVINDDPSVYDAYLFKADIIRDKNQALEQARAAIQYNPDYPRAWLVLGKAAAALGDRMTLADAVAKLKVIAPGSQELAQLAALPR